MLEAFERLHLTSSDFYTQLNTSDLPQRLREPLNIRRLDSFVICNFKSFKETVYVGPLLNMTSVVGPNGAGKSNLLDAMMFCFCNEKTRLTYYDLRQFINRTGSETYSTMGNRRCSVQARFQLADNRVLTLQRWLTASEQEGFLIDGEEYPRNVYENFLLHCHIHHSAVNYAIWQGEIDKLLLKDPREISAYFNQLSGSACFREEQQQVQKELDKLDEELTAKGGRLLKFRQERKNMKNLETFRKAKTQILEEYQLLSNKLVLLKAYMSDMGLKELEKELHQKQKNEQMQIKKHNELKAKMQRDHAECSELENRCQSLRKELAEYQRTLRAREQANTLLEAQDVQELGRELTNLEKYLAHLKDQSSTKEEEMKGLHSTDVSKEYLQLYARWETENEAANRQLVKRREEYLSIEGILQGKRAALQEYQAKQEKLKKNQEQDSVRLNELRKSVSEVEQNIDKLRKEGSQMEKQAKNNHLKLEETEKKLAAAYAEVDELENILTENIEKKHDADLVKKLKNIEGFNGIVEQWVKPGHRKFELCFRQMLAPSLKYLLCQTETAARFVSLRLKENLTMRTVVILDNIKPQKEVLTRASLGKIGTPAIDVVEFDKSIDKLELYLKDALRGKVICDDLATAYQLLEQKIRGVREIYTLEGEVLGMDGMVETCGNHETSKKYRYLNTHTNQARIHEQVAELQKRIHSLTIEVEPLRKGTSEDIRRNHAEIDKLQARKEELTMKMQLLETTLKNKGNSKPPKELEREIEELSERSRKLDRLMKSIESEMAKSPIFAAFLKNHHTDVDSFRSLQDISSLQSVVRLRTKLARELQEITHQISKVENQIQAKTVKQEQLRKKVEANESENLPQLKEKVKAKQAELDQLQLRLNELKNKKGEVMVFKSQVPQAAAKLTLAKDMHIKLLKEQIKNEELREKVAEGDYSLLKDAPKGSNEDLKQWGEELEKERQKLEADLDKYNIGIINMGGDEGSSEALKRQVEELKEELGSLNQRKEELLQKLSAIKQDRKKLFMEFLDQLKPVLSRAYEVLTQNGDGFVGKIEVTLQNPSFPCDKGLYLLPVPPGKRYTYDIGQLSGGQKSIVSLALHYAIAVASRSPFLVLDETDAFLDKYNVERLFKLISHSLNKKQMQFVLITHKRGLFLKSISLVGLTRSEANPFTKAYSIKLEDDTQNNSNHPEQS